MAAWMLSGTAALVAMALWKSYGGHIYLPEVGVVAAGHLLNAGLTIALAAAAAAITEHPSTAAIVTLGVTVGTWAVDFLAAVHGGAWEQLAAYTPVAMIGTFQRGLLRADLVLIALAGAACGLVVAAIGTRLGVPVRRRAIESLVAVAAAGIVVPPAPSSGRAGTRRRTGAIRFLKPRKKRSAACPVRSPSKRTSHSAIRAVSIWSTTCCRSSAAYCRT